LDLGIRGDYMPNNIDRNEFEQYERRIDDKFENLNDKINNLPNIIEDKIKYQIADMKNTQIKWFIGTLIVTLGLAGRVFGLY
jgi:seryl-tRNA synthetase